MNTRVNVYKNDAQHLFAYLVHSLMGKNKQPLYLVDSDFILTERNGEII